MLNKSEANPFYYREQDLNSSVWSVSANYRHQTKQIYRGNPLIEALRPSLTDQKVADLLKDYPQFDQTHPLLPTNDRLYRLVSLTDFFHPFDRHLELYHRLDETIREGYVGRNIFDLPHSPEMYKDSIPDQRELMTTLMHSLICWGGTDLGKSQTVEQILSLFPQMIYHRQYQNQELLRVQATWLKLNWPIDCTSRSFCLNLIIAFDHLRGNSSFYNQYTREGNAREITLKKVAKFLCDLFKLGLLVIDQIPPFSKINEHEAQKLLKFIVRLSITVGVPIVLIGNEDALNFFATDFPDLALVSQREKLVWERLKKDEKDWKILINQLWQYQYVRQPVVLTEELNSAMYQATKGIIALITSVFILAQIRAIETGLETITPELICTAADKGWGLANLPAD